MNNVVYVDFNRNRLVTSHNIQLENLINQKSRKWAEFRQLNKLIESKLTLTQFKPLMFLKWRERCAKLKTLTKSKKLNECGDKLISLLDEIDWINNEIDSMELIKKHRS